MNIKKPSEEILNESIQTYFKTGDIKHFLEIGSIWLMYYSSRNDRLDEDDISEILIIFLEKAKYCLDWCKKNHYDNFKSFLFRYFKNLINNYLRLKKYREIPSHLILWDEDRKNQEYKLKEQSITIRLQELLKEQSFLNRIILYFRYNIQMEHNEQEDLRIYLEKLNLTIDEFFTFRNNRLKTINEKKIELIRQLNLCNKKIFESNGNIKESIRKKKQNIANRLSSLNYVFTFCEMSNLLKIPRHKVMKLHDQSISDFKRILDEEAA